MAFGLGGVLVEILKDVTFRLAPASMTDAESMLDDIRAAEVLRGDAGGPAVDRTALADLIVRVSRLAADFPEIAEVDLNPVFAAPEGVLAADVRIVLGDGPPPRRRRYAKRRSSPLWSG
ncbi:CoA-binding protein OS=Streptomyces rimosus subsp. rimosus (strain ATCC / DSM 40260/ JCM 4667 / NRRL 2234) OX=1265868 GN=SRIM_033990 PE=4 SV=1 [Streptomyces rimosus subsp. rimosus]